MQITTNTELDLSGLNCPMPLLKTKQALNRMESGQVIKVIATDPSSQRDFQVFSEQSGITILQREVLGAQFLYWLQKP